MMEDLVFCLLLIMVFTGGLIIIAMEDMLLNIDKTWSRKNLFGKLQISLLIIWLVPAIIASGFLYFALSIAEKITDFISDFVAWFVKLGNKK